MGSVLWLIAVVLIAVWLFALVFKIAGAIIHLILVVALAIFIVGYLKRRVRGR